MVFDMNKYPKYIIEDSDLDDLGFITDEPDGHVNQLMRLRPDDEALDMAYWTDCSIKTYRSVMSSEDITNPFTRSKECTSIYPKQLFNKKPWLTLTDVWINLKSKVTCSVLHTGPFGEYKKYYEVYKWMDMGHPCIIYSHKNYDLSRKFFNKYVTKEWVINFCNSNKEDALKATQDYQEEIEKINQKSVNRSPERLYGKSKGLRGDWRDNYIDK